MSDPKTVLEADYLVVGAGAMGMAFVDTIVTETDRTVVMVDRHARPGGHWNDAYPFVRLHQPSSFYGVNSRPLGSDAIDEVGWNAGLFELASGTEVVTYFDQVMQQQFLPSGRVEYLPLTDHEGDGRVRSLLSGEVTDVRAATTVDATYMNVRVPSQTPPGFDVAPGVTCVPLNDLPERGGASRYVIVGAGKTGMDACLFLLANGLAPDAITWVMPRDSWILDRANIQPGPRFFDRTVANAAVGMQASAEASSVEDLFDRLEAEGALMRIDRSVRPTMYRCATCTRAELEQLRRIADVVRMGRVRRLEPGRMELDEGFVEVPEDTVFVHCAADGLERRPTKPVFDGDRITLQTVRHCQQVFSAAFIAHVEAAYDDQDAKNELATVVPHPHTDVDWLRTTLGNTLNAARWRADAGLAEWLSQARLDGFSRVRTGEGASEAVRQSMAVIAEHGPAAVANLQRLIAETEAVPDASTGRAQH